VLRIPMFGAPAASRMARVIKPAAVQEELFHDEFSSVGPLAEQKTAVPTTSRYRVGLALRAAAMHITAFWLKAAP
jgi:hypothetical protein